jgi:predicted DNA-binding ribbon-helix-helix protein
MDLPEELEKQFQIELKAFEEARQMKYVTTIERMAEERAKLEEKREISLNMLRKNMSPETIAEITGLTIEQIQALQAQTT